MKFSVWYFVGVFIYVEFVVVLSFIVIIQFVGSPVRTARFNIEVVLCITVIFVTKKLITQFVRSDWVGSTELTF